MKTVPYNTGKVLIGCRYKEPQRAWEPTRTESMLQSALLDGKRTDWDGIAIIIVCAAIMALPYLVMAVRI